MQYVTKYSYQFFFLLICLFWILLQLIYPHAMLYANGDYGTLYLHAEYLIENKSPISPEYYQATELKLLYPSIFFVPFIYFFDDYITVKIFATLLLIILMLLTYIYHFKRFGLSAKYGFLAMFIFLLPLSNHWIYIGILGSFYFIYYMQTILTIALLYHIIEEKNKNIIKILILLYTVLTIIGGITSSRTIQIIYFPLLISSLCMLILYKLQNLNFNFFRKTTLISFYGLIISTISYVFAEKVLKKITDYHKYSIDSLNLCLEKKDIERLFENIYGTFSLYKWDDILSIVSNIFIIFSVIIFIYFCYALISKIKNEKINLLIIFLIISSFIQMCLLIIYPGYRPRYYFPVLIIFTVIVVLYFAYFKDKSSKIIKAIYILSLIIHGIVVVYYTYTPDKWKEQDYWIYRANFLKEERDDILSYVTEKKYNHGFAWHDEAHQIHILSNGNISVGSTVFNIKNCTIVPRRVESLRKYYIKEQKDVPAFFIVPRHFYNKCKDKNNLLLENKYTYENKIYFVFEGTKNKYLEYIK